MKLLALLGLGAVVTALLYQTFAVSRKNPPTTAELRRKAFEHLAPNYRYTQPSNEVRLAMRIARRRQEQKVS